MNAVRSVSVVVPVYNSSQSLPLLVERLEPVLQGLGGAFEVILVNDGSHDDSWAVIQGLAGCCPWVRGINLMRNFGQHNTLLCGIRAACHDTIVTLDDDLQHPPEEIPRLLATLAEGHDVVYGYPMQEQHGILRDLASWITKRVMEYTMGVRAARHISAYRAFQTNLRQAFSSYSGSFVSIDVLLSWGTTRFTAIPVSHHARTHGRSNYTFGKLVFHALNMITGFTTLPLRFATLMGLLFTLFGAGVLVFVVSRYLIQGGSVPGFPFLASIISILSGVQLFTLGVIGEYLARVFLRLMDRPAYVVQTTLPEAPAAPSARADGPLPERNAGP